MVEMCAEKRRDVHTQGEREWGGERERERERERVEQKRMKQKIQEDDAANCARSMSDGAEYEVKTIYRAANLKSRLGIFETKKKRIFFIFWRTT